MVWFPLSATGDDENEKEAQHERNVVRFHQRQLQEAQRRLEQKETTQPAREPDPPRNGSRS